MSVKFYADMLLGMQSGEELEVPSDLNLQSLRTVFNAGSRELEALFGKSARRYIVFLPTEPVKVRVTDTVPTRENYADEPQKLSRAQKLEAGALLQVDSQSDVLKLYYELRKKNLHLQRWFRPALKTYWVWVRSKRDDPRLDPEVTPDA